MKLSVTASGKTLEQAIESGLKKLETERDKVKIDVIQEPKRKLFGLLGKQNAVVRVRLIEPDSPVDRLEAEIVNKPTSARRGRARLSVDQEASSSVKLKAKLSADQKAKASVEEKAQLAKEFLEQVTKDMGLDVDVEVNIKNHNIFINLISHTRKGILIGYRGKTLDALQYLTNLAVNHGDSDYTRVTLDTENYRKRRRQTLENLADRTAIKALRTHEKQSLEPMSPAERRIIHARLQNNNKIETYSKGEDPYRYIVIQASR